MAAVPSSGSGRPTYGPTATMKSEVRTAHGAVPSPSTVDALQVQTLGPDVTVSTARPLASTAMSWVSPCARSGMRRTGRWVALAAAWTFRLIRRLHPNRMVRGSGIALTDPYLEWCWLPVVGPSTVALVGTSLTSPPSPVKSASR